MFVAEKALLLLVITLTDKASQSLAQGHFNGTIWNIPDHIFPT